MICLKCLARKLWREAMTRYAVYRLYGDLREMQVGEWTRPTK